MTIGEDSQDNSQDQQTHKRIHRKKEKQERPALQKQAPVQVFIPAGKKAIELFPDVESMQRYSRKSHVGVILVVIFRKVFRYLAGCLEKRQLDCASLSASGSCLGHLSALRGT